MKSRFVFSLVLAILVLVGFALTAQNASAVIATINPSIDTTMAQELPDNSSGECDSIFAGQTDANFSRRALIQFDIAGSILPGSIINSVTLSMTVTRGGNNNDAVFSLHRVTTPWGEGTNGCGVRGGGQGEPAVDGSATWNSAMHNQTLWTTAGGDYNPTASGSTLVVGSATPGSATPVWDSTVAGNAAMVSDVEGWLNGTTPNYGWVLIGDEANPVTTRRFGSSEGIAPVLTIDYTPTGPVEECCDVDGNFNGFCSLVPAGECLNPPLVPNPEPTCSPNPCPQPIGACCNADNSCSEDQDRLVCENAGGTFQGDGTGCNQVDCGLEPFIEPLPIPPIMQPTGTRPDGVPQYTISVEEATQSVHPELPSTDLWTYNGAWPTATIVATKGQPIEVTYINNLPAGGGGNRGNNILEVDTCAHGPNSWGDSKRVVTHLHGGHVPARVDGQPEYHILPGQTDIYEYPNNQDAATLWYHDHALGITRLNVYGGMAGYYLLADAEDTLGPDNAFGLPSGPYEIGLAIQDRTFNPDGSLFYNAQLEDAFKGETVVVNGKIQPFLNVDQGKYRFRILNGSQSREYSLRLETVSPPEQVGNDPRFILVGTDVGLTSAPIDLGNTISIYAPAERMDAVIDFAGYPAGTEIILRNDDTTPPLLPSIMKFVVTANPGYTGTISPTLREVIPMGENTADVTRHFRLEKLANKLCKDGSGRLVNEWVVQSLDGPGGTVIGEFWDDLTEFPILGTREIWEFENPTSSMHPMHVHLVKFQILDKTDLTTGQPIPLMPWEANTWKDTVRVPANSRARIIMDFTDYLGRFPQHCHILDHEDHEMMRQFQTTNDPANCNLNGICEVGEDCVSCADCLQVSGALCGNGLCEAGDGENCVTCPEDCAGKQKGSASGQFCCGFDDGQVTNPIGCGFPNPASDDRCINSRDNLYCRVEPRLLACCGDALCEGQEGVTGNSPDTYCALDCEEQQQCVPTEPTEVSCFDDLDNDCDLATDCADTDCDGAVGPPTTCGVGICESTGNLTCTGGTEVDTCTPGTPGVEGPPGDLTCNDGLDNDCDGLTDTAEDPDCQDTGSCDGLDRNTCRNTPGCEWVGGKSGMCVDATCTPTGPEAGFCNDGIDNDCDGATDCADTADCGNDPVCQQPDCSQYSSQSTCEADPACRWRKKQMVCVNG